MGRAGNYEGRRSFAGWVETLPAAAARGAQLRPLSARRGDPGLGGLGTGRKSREDKLRTVNMFFTCSTSLMATL